MKLIRSSGIILAINGTVYNLCLLSLNLQQKSDAINIQHFFNWETCDGCRLSSQGLLWRGRPGRANELS